MTEQIEPLSESAEATLRKITELTARYDAEMDILCREIGKSSEDGSRKERLLQKLMSEYFPLFIALAKELGASEALKATSEIGITVPWYNIQGAMKVRPFERLNKRSDFMVMLTERALQVSDVGPTQLDTESTSARVGSVLTQ